MNHPPPQSYYGSGWPPPIPRNGLGTAALVIGVIALLGCWVPFAGLALGVTALLTAMAARSRVKRGGADNRGVATAGLVMGITSTVIGAVVSALLLFVIINQEQCIAHAKGRYEYSRC